MLYFSAILDTGRTRLLQTICTSVFLILVTMLTPTMDDVNGTLSITRVIARIRHRLSYAVVTCEIKLLRNNFDIISVFYWTCNQV